MEKKSSFTIEPYSEVLIREIKRTKDYLKPKDLIKICKAVSIVVIDPHLKIQEMRSELSDATFTYVLFADTEILKRESQAEPVKSLNTSQKNNKRKDIHVEADPSSVTFSLTECDLIQNEGTEQNSYESEKIKYVYIVSEVKKSIYASNTDSTLYLVLSKRYPLFLSF